MDTITLLSIIAISGALLTAIVQLVDVVRHRGKAKQETIEQRIQHLSNSLSNAASLISQIEREVESRRTLVERLKSDQATYDKLVALKKPEVEAIAQLLRGELRKEGRRSFWENAGLNFFFFLAGALVSYCLVS